ncbi:MAG: hypothetical protein IIC40_03710 [Candidatus Marinimicrobia bacterium]|nr:hypothetical protein [Candidatus Neomarinimicrobiota bacterium]
MDIRSVITVPEMESEEETRIAHILFIIIVSSVILTTTYLIIAMFESPFQLYRFLMSLTLLLIILASYALLHLQKIHATSIVVSISGLIFTTVTVLLTGGIRAPMVGGYFLVFLVAGILLGKKGGIIFTLLSLISWAGIFVVEFSGNLPVSLVEHDILRIWILNSMLFAMAATVIYLAIKYLGEVLALVKRQRDNLEEMVSIRTRELEDANKDLKKQQEDLIHAEQQRVMMESVGAALHHFSQPLTAMEMAIEKIMTVERSDEFQKEKLYDLYKKSKKDLDDILNKFQQIRKYRTKPYAVGIEILDIDSDSKEN